MKRETVVHFQRSPVIYSWRWMSFFNPALAIDAERALLAEHDGSKLALLEAIELRASKRCSVCFTKKRRSVLALGNRESPWGLTIRGNIGWRPRL